MQQLESTSSNLFQRFAAYSLSSRNRAIRIAVICSLLPLLGWLAITVLSLVTLRKGAKESAMVLLWVLVANCLLAYIANIPGILLNNVIYAVVFTWILALVLHYTGSWARVVEAGALIAVLGIVVVHLLIGDVQQYWLTYLSKGYAWVNQYLQLQLSADDIKALAGTAAKYITGVQAATILGSNLINLGIARWLQSLLYNPGGLQKELYMIRLPYIIVAIITVCLLATLSGAAISYDIIPVILLPAIIAGLSLLHQSMAKIRYGWGGLFVYYVFLILFFPYMLILTSLTAVADAFFDFRRLFAEKKILMLDKRG